MSDLERMELLKSRLDRIQHEPFAAWQRSIREVARLALETELTDIGRRMTSLDHQILRGAGKGHNAFKLGTTESAA